MHRSKEQYYSINLSAWTSSVAGTLRASALPGRPMVGFVERVDRGQSTLFPARLDDYVAEDNPVRAVDVSVGGLDLD